MNENSAQPAPQLPAVLASVVKRLPQWPPSTVLCAGLNLLFLPTLDADTKQRLMGRIVSIQVSDAGLDGRIRLTSIGFLPVLGSAPEVTISACAWDYYRLARRLSIDGDTELGLLIKNLLDAIDWSRFPGPLGAAIDKLRHLAESRGTRHKPTP